jgi:P27 family predicted phage terminase small subunit
MSARKPTHLKLLTGTARKSRMQREPVPEAGAPPPPPWLDETGRGYWAALAPELEAMRVLTRADGPALALVCVALVEHERAAATVAKEGAVYKTVTEAGAVMHRPRPEVGVAQDAWRRAMKGLCEFGMSPASRGRIDVTSSPRAVGPVDPTAEFFDDSAEEYFSRRG